MKARRLILLGTMVLAMVIPLSRAWANYGYSSGVEVRQVSDFYEPLAPFGYWTEVPRYGWCWYPTNVEQGWRPYANGHWLWSDSGWYWASEEPWGWATYHYGRWVWDPYYGWLWSPGVEWAPAWVAWREGGDYVGWAPLPPECDFGPGANVIYAPQIVIAPQYFVFVQQVNFCNIVRPNCVIVNNPAICNRTVNITNINRVNQCIVNRGPSFETIDRSNPGRVQRARIERPLPQQSADSRTAPEIIRGTHRQADTTIVAPPESVVDRRVERPRPTATEREERPRMDIRENVKQRNADQQPVVVHQIPPRSSSQKPTATAVQSQPAATDDAATPQSEPRREREDRPRVTQRAETASDQPNGSSRAALLSQAR